MTSVHARCRELSAEALDSLQSTKPRAVSVAVRKLEVCARLLSDEELLRWCTFHLGGYAYQLPHAPSELTNDYANKVVSKLLELKVPFSTQEVLPTAVIETTELASRQQHRREVVRVSVRSK